MQIVVLGPHRSGTSLVTRLINLMGAYFGDEHDAIDSAEDNPKGFWERKDVVEANDAVLRAFKCGWDDLAGWSFDSPAREIPESVRDTVGAAVRKLDQHSTWVVKDPRLCLTLPYWRPHLSRAVTVVVSRDPGEVAISLARRNNVSLSHALAIWEYSAVGILRQRMDLPTVHVSHEAFLDRPAEATAELYESLTRLGASDLTLPSREAIEAFVDSSLHRSRPAEGFHSQLLTPRHLELHAALEGRVQLDPADASVSELAATTMQAYRDLVSLRDWSQRIQEHAAAVDADRKRLLSREEQQAQDLVRMRKALEAAETAADDLRTVRDTVVAEFDARTAERDAMLAELLRLRRSWTWRLTAPLRFVGYALSGNVTKVRFIAKNTGRRVHGWLPLPLRHGIDRTRRRLLSVTGIMPTSTANFKAIVDIVDERCRSTSAALGGDPLTARLADEPPAVDISAVTFNSHKWIDGFVKSVIALRYPAERITVRFVDNSSTDETPQALDAAVAELKNAGISAEWMSRPNKGYGAGHNAAIAKGTAPFCLVTNVDLTFEPDALARVVAAAACDAEAGAWELRQKPYEHPKFYDPITGSTNWNSHACVLLGRAALETVGTYDETLFMYGEDVELSYRLRRGGYRLRYCPQAVVFHYSYESPDRVKPTQYTGSTFANLYLRLKYGRLTDVLAVPFMAARLALAPQPFPGARRAALANMGRLALVAPKALFARRPSQAQFPFRVWDYDLIRDGAFVAVAELPADPPLVTVVTRTYRGRSQFLRQCLLSVAHQTYPHIEHIVVEDGGSTAQPTVDEVGRLTGRPARFIALDKVGRSVAGNRGLTEANGRWCLFLDDDDLLFADHVEVLVAALLKDHEAVAAYALSWEVTTDGGADGYVEISHGVPGVHRQKFDYNVLRHHNYMSIQAVLFERRLYLERGGFDEDMEILEDWMLWIRYAHGGRFAYVPKVTSMFRTPAQPAKVGERLEAFNNAYPLAVARVEARIRALEAGSTR